MFLRRVGKRILPLYEQQDQFALESHKRALAAIQNGEFKEEILPYTVTENSPDLTTEKITGKTKIISQDEGPRAGSTLELLAKLPTVFAAFLIPSPTL